MSEREEKFEKMLLFVQERYEDTVRKMDTLKAQGKEKSVTFRQLMGDKLNYQNMLNMYKMFGIIEK